jgi:hypothetical protein
MNEQPTAFETTKCANFANGSIVGRGSDPAGIGMFNTESTKSAENFRRDPVAMGGANRPGEPGSESQYPMPNVQCPISKALNGPRPAAVDSSGGPRPPTLAPRPLSQRFTLSQ